MPLCPKCQHLISRQQQATGVCPTCQPAAEDAPWSDVARVPNLAEAGYLVSFLEYHEIEARLVHAESFSATSGSWASDYVLQVPSEYRQQAAEIVRTEAAALQDEQPEYNDFGEPITEEPLQLVIWRPVALMALAGLAILWLGHRIAEQRARDTPQRPDEALAEAIAAIGRPLVATSPGGQVQHRLSYDAATQTWLLESDTNRDGRFDRRQVFAQPVSP
ncbi:hypothetical protein [Aeoliella mucimassa]|uniref:DUF2007 domain-containing protein n=1 Tax=Aeoliella mucimassa TaxID=2527972 RepID=A0A518AK76_9BACT|nr:hypothetical protein [Aeoliella mucimassa]QDU55137.1 hypothetical protein Pan181_13230 [Aeoliella mucimassa]